MIASYPGSATSTINGGNKGEKEESKAKSHTNIEENTYPYMHVMQGSLMCT